MAFKYLVAAGLALGALTAPVLADSTTPAAPTTKADASDPNKVMCRRIETIGTRLDTKRVCRTRAEWEAEHASNRQDLDRAQNMRGARGGG